LIQGDHYLQFTICFTNYRIFISVMDPLTSLSVAGTIVRFVDFGTKLLSQSYELYKSRSGKLAADEELELVTADLCGLVSKIRHANISRPSEMLGPETEDIQKHQAMFGQICNKAMQVAQELLTKLGELRIKETKNRKLETLHQVLKRVWSKDDINTLLDRLQNLSEAFKTEVIVAIL